MGTAAAMPLLTLAEGDRAAHRLDALDDYVEAHVHGPLRLAGDAEAIVLDPCYRGTDVERAASSLAVVLEWHHGFVLDAGDLDIRTSYRGEHIVDVGRQVAGALNTGGHLDPAVLGRAAATGRWHAQDLRRLWHCVAHFGHQA